MFRRYLHKEPQTESGKGGSFMKPTELSFVDVFEKLSRSLALGQGIQREMAEVMELLVACLNLSPCIGPVPFARVVEMILAIWYLEPLC